MYKILLVGHGGFPQGLKSALELILGKQANLLLESISQTRGHSFFENKIRDFIQKNNHIIIFADLTGGAPHQICVRRALEHKAKNIFIVSGAPLAFLTELLLTNDLQKDHKKDEAMLKRILRTTTNMARIIKV